MIVPIVEGDGDAAALPGLVIRILAERYGRSDVLVAQGKRGVVKANGRQTLERRLDKFLGHAQNRPDCAAVLIVVDADDDCPVELAARLAERCSRIGGRFPVQIVCAQRSYESWFLASLATIRGRHGIPDTATLPADAENMPDPKRWLTKQMPPGQVYKPTTHQPSLSGAIDPCLAHRKSRSFRRLCHALEQLVDAMDSPTG